MKLSKQYEVEHEQASREGWPGRCFDVPVLIEVYKSMTTAQKNKFWEEGLKDFNNYLEATKPRYFEYYREASIVGDPDKQSWIAFFQATSEARKTLRSRILSRLLSVVE